MILNKEAILNILDRHLDAEIAKMPTNDIKQAIATYLAGAGNQITQTSMCDLLENAIESLYLKIVEK